LISMESLLKFNDDLSSNHYKNASISDNSSSNTAFYQAISSEIIKSFQYYTDSSISPSISPWSLDMNHPSSPTVSTININYSSMPKMTFNYLPSNYFLCSVFLKPEHDKNSLSTLMSLSCLPNLLSKSQYEAQSDTQLEELEFTTVSPPEPSSINTINPSITIPIPSPPPVITNNNNNYNNINTKSNTTSNIHINHVSVPSQISLKSLSFQHSSPSLSFLKNAKSTITDALTSYYVSPNVQSNINPNPRNTSQNLIKSQSNSPLSYNTLPTKRTPSSNILSSQPTSSQSNINNLPPPISQSSSQISQNQPQKPQKPQTFGQKFMKFMTSTGNNSQSKSHQ
jgi:hypothetical protein